LTAAIDQWLAVDKLLELAVLTLGIRYSTGE